LKLIAAMGSRQRRCSDPLARGRRGLRALTSTRQVGDAWRVSSGDSSSDPFTSELARRVLAEACRNAAFSVDGAELLRLGENAMFRLNGVPLVVRIGRSVERLPIVERELCVAR
jgi:hypothetical protein